MMALILFLLAIAGFGLFIHNDYARIERLKRDRYNNPFPSMKQWRDHSGGRTHPFANDINHSEKRCFAEGWLEWERPPSNKPTKYWHGKGGAAVLTASGLAALKEWEKDQPVRPDAIDSALWTG